MAYNEDSSASGHDEPWIQWFCGLKGHEMFCEVERSYIEDGFNLYGLRACVTNFSDCLDLILDRIGPDDSDDSHLTQSACTLYGLIHARYIITAHGLDAMYNKYAAKEFGSCPLVQCQGQPVLPLGLKDEVGYESVKVFCPKCHCVYHPPPPRRGGTGAVDGAAFGTTFAHLFLMTFQNLVPEPLSRDSIYIPRVFGFRVHNTATSSITNAANASTSAAQATLSRGPEGANNRPAVPNSTAAAQQAIAAQEQAVQVGQSAHLSFQSTSGGIKQHGDTCPSSSAAAPSTVENGFAGGDNPKTGDDGMQQEISLMGGNTKNANHADSSVTTSNIDNNPSKSATAVSSSAAGKNIPAASSSAVDKPGPLFIIRNDNATSQSPPPDDTVPSITGKTFARPSTGGEDESKNAPSTEDMKPGRSQGAGENTAAKDVNEASTTGPLPAGGEDNEKPAGSSALDSRTPFPSALVEKSPGTTAGEQQPRSQSTRHEPVPLSKGGTDNASGAINNRVGVNRDPTAGEKHGRSGEGENSHGPCSAGGEGNDLDDPSQKDNITGPLLSTPHKSAPNNSEENSTGERPGENAAVVQGEDGVISLQQSKRCRMDDGTPTSAADDLNKNVRLSSQEAKRQRRPNNNGDLT